MSGVLKHLREHGPSTFNELGTEASIKDRQRGVWRLDISKKAACGKNGNGYGNLKSVYYIRGEHSKEEVVEKWLNANPEVADAEQRDISRLLGRAGSGWREAGKEVVA